MRDNVYWVSLVSQSTAFCKFVPGSKFFAIVAAIENMIVGSSI